MTANDIRNIALLGHGGSGKTSLAEQMLFMTKGTDRLGRTADGNTTCDYDAEEIKRQFGIEVDKRKVVLPMDIKAFGTYNFDVKFYAGITATMSVAVCEKD